MARAKISQLDPKGADLSSTDLFEVSVNTGSGYDTYSITGQEIVDGVLDNVTLDLQAVTDNGNTTTNSIQVHESGDNYSDIYGDTIIVSNTANSTYSSLSSDGTISLKTNDYPSALVNNNVTNPNVILEFPNKTAGSYTIATTSDLTSGYVPYIGATQDVDLDANKISAESVYIEGTNGAGHLHLKHQNADATATGQSTALFADVNGDIKYKNDNDYYTTLKTSLNTANRVYTFPDVSGVVALQEIIFDKKATSYTLVLGDAYKLIEMEVTSANTLTIPTNASVPFPLGTQILVSQLGTGQTTITPAVGVTLRSSGGKTKTAAQYSMCTLIKRGANEWYLSGDLTT